LQESLTDVCGLLSQRHIRFALVGGIAASLRGRLRATEDVDFVLLTDVEVMEMDLVVKIQRLQKR